MFLSAFYIIAFKTGGLLYTFLYFLCSYVFFFGCLCSLLWALGGAGGGESLFCVVELYISWYSSSGSLIRWSLLGVVITSHLKQLRIATAPVRIRFLSPHKRYFRISRFFFPARYRFGLNWAFIYCSFCSYAPIELMGNWTVSIKCGAWPSPWILKKILGFIWDFRSSRHSHLGGPPIRFIGDWFF